MAVDYSGEIDQEHGGDELKEKLAGAYSKMRRKVYIRMIKPGKFRTILIRLWLFRFIAMLLIWVIALQLRGLSDLIFSSRGTHHKYPLLDPPRVYNNNGYLMVSANGGLNQMRSGICDMVAIARFLNVTLIVPELDNTSFWNDRSQFEDIFDVEYFIDSLRDEVKILKELPSKQKNKASESLFSMPPVSWSNMTYYYNVVLPRIQTNEVVHFQKTDARLANNGVPPEVQKLRCRANYQALRFAPPIQAMAEKIVQALREKGPFLVLHLRYEMDMIAFSGCNEGCNEDEVKELTAMRYAYPWWKEKVIDGVKKRQAGLCPMTPEETALTLQALGIDRNIQVYIAAGDIYGGERRLASLRAAYPNLVKKETLLPASELDPFRNHSNQMAALDYYVAVESDIFIPTNGGNMAKVVEGHRRFLGFRKTILLDREVIVDLVDLFRSGAINWEEFSTEMNEAHAKRMGNPTPRLVIPGKPKEEDYFYTNPEECLESPAAPSPPPPPPQISGVGDNNQQQDQATTEEAEEEA